MHVGLALIGYELTAVFSTTANNVCNVQAKSEMGISHEGATDKSS